MILILAMNIALIKNTVNESVFLDDFVSNIKQVFGSLRSYGFSLKKRKKNNVSFSTFKRKNHFLNSKFTRKKI